MTNSRLPNINVITDQEQLNNTYDQYVLTYEELHPEIMKGLSFDGKRMVRSLDGAGVFCDLEVFLEREETNRVKNSNIAKNLSNRVLDAAAFFLAQETPVENVPDIVKFTLGICHDNVHWTGLETCLPAFKAQYKVLKEILIDKYGKHFDKNRTETHRFNDALNMIKEYLLTRGYIYQNNNDLLNSSPTLKYFNDNNTIQIKHYDSLNNIENHKKVEQGLSFISDFIDCQHVVCSIQHGLTCGDHTIINLFMSSVLNKLPEINNQSGITSSDLRSIIEMNVNPIEQKKVILKVLSNLTQVFITEISVLTLPEEKDSPTIIDTSKLAPGFHIINYSNGVDSGFIHIHEKGIDINLSGEGNSYAITFGELYDKNKDISINASKNIIYIENSVIHCKEIDVISDSLSIASNTNINSSHFETLTNHIESHGSVTSNDMMININEAQSGLENHGNLIIKDKFYQVNGKFDNKGKFEANQMQIDSTDFILNDENSTLNVKQATINIDTLINNGRSFIGHSNISCNNVEVNGWFGGGNMTIEAAGTVNFTPSSHCNFNDLNCSADGSLILEGNIFKSNIIKLNSNIIHINKGSEFDSCNNISLTSANFLKVHNGVIFNKVVDANFESRMLFFDGNCEATKSITVNGKETMVVNEGCKIKSDTISLKGKDLYLYGKLDGELSFPDRINHLYLADKSVIERCKVLHARAYVIEAYGKVSSTIAKLNAELAILTNEKTELNSRLIQTESDHIKLSGDIKTTTLTSTAKKFQLLTPRLTLNSTVSKILAPRVQLEGVINSEVLVQAKHLVNSAKIKSNKDATLRGEALLLNSPGSSIESKTAELSGNQLASHGRVSATQSMITHGSDIHFGDNSVTTTPEANIKGRDINIAGEINATTKLDVSASDNLSLFNLNAMKGGHIELKAGANVTGSLNIASTSANVSAGNSTFLLGGHSKVEGDLNLSSRTLFASNQMTAQDINIIKPSDSKPGKTSCAYISQESIIKVKKIHENVSSFTSSGSIEADLAIMHSEKNVNITKNASVSFKTAMDVKTQIFEQAGGIHNNEESQNAGDQLSIQADTANFRSSSLLDLQTGAGVTANNVSYAGHIDANSLLTDAKDTKFKSSSTVSKRTRVTTFGQKNTLSSLTIENGAKIESKLFEVVNVDKVEIHGNVLSQTIKMKINYLHLASFAVLGTMFSQIHIEAERAYLEGRLEADNAFLRCSQSIIQDGKKGNSSIKATNLNMTAPFLINFLGVTEAQQANFTSLINLCFGPKFMNYVYDNSMYSPDIFPRSFHAEFLLKTIEDVKAGKIDIFSAKSLQYTTQGLLNLLKPILPAPIGLAVDIVMNSYFIANGFSQLPDILNNLSSLEEVKLVDLLPLILTTKNMAVSAVSLKDSIDEFYNIPKNPILDAIADATDYMGIDLPENIKDALHRHQPKKDGTLPDGQYNKKLVEDVKSTKEMETKVQKSLWDNVTPKHDKRENKTTITQSFRRWVTTNYEDLQDSFAMAKADFANDPQAFIKKSAVSTYDIVNEGFSNYILPGLLLVAPSYNKDSLINMDLCSPVFTGSYNQRGVLTYSWFSPHFGLSNNKVGLYSLTNNCRQFSYIESLSGLHVYHDADSYAHRYTVRSNNYTLGLGHKVRAAHTYIDESHAKAHDVKGSKSQTFKYDTVDNEQDFLTLSGQYGCYRPDDVTETRVTHMASHHIDLNRTLILPWSATIQGTGIHVHKDVEVKSNGRDGLGLVSTKDSILNQGTLTAPTISLRSANKIDMVNGINKSEKVYLTAYNDINLNLSDVSAKEGYIRSQRGHVQLDASSVKFSGFGAVIAHTDVIVNCTSKDIITNRYSDKQYFPSILKGGDGKDHNGLGLYVRAGNRIINAGSEIGAIGNYFLDGLHGILGIAYTNPYRIKSTRHRNILGVNRYENVDSVRVQHPTFFSETGRGILRAAHGRVDVTAGIFDAKLSTYMFSREAPMFRDFNVHNTFTTKKSLLGIRFAETEHETDEMMGQIFRSPESLGIETLYGDIVIPNSSIHTDYLYTDAWAGQTRIYQDSVYNRDRSRFLTIGCHAGPIQYSLSTDSNDTHQNTFLVTDPLLDSIKSTRNSNSSGQAASSLLSIADNAAGKVGSLASKNYPGVIDTSVGVTVGYTTNESRYQTQGRYDLRIGKWEDCSRDGISLGGMSGTIDELDMRCGKIFDVNGQTLAYSHRTRTVTGGASFNPLTEQVDFTGSYSESKSNGEIATPARLIIKRAIFRNETDISVNNAQVHVGELQGTVSNLSLKSEYDDCRTTSSSYSGSASDILRSANLSTVGVGHHESTSHAVNSPATFEVDDMSNGHIRHVSSDAGRLAGDGFKDHKPDSIDQIPANNSHKSTGFDVAFNVKEGRPQSISLFNTRDTSSTFITETDKGISMKTTEHHSGVDLSIVVPANLIGLAKQYQGKDKQEQQHPQQLNDDVRKTPEMSDEPVPELDDHDLALLSNNNWSDPMNYSKDLDNLPKSKQSDTTSLDVPHASSKPKKTVLTKSKAQAAEPSIRSAYSVPEISYFNITADDDTAKSPYAISSDSDVLSQQEKDLHDTNHIGRGIKIPHSNSHRMKLSKLGGYVRSGFGVFDACHTVYTNGVELFHAASESLDKKNSTLFNGALTKFGFTKIFSVSGSTLGARTGAVACAPFAPVAPWAPVACGVAGFIAGGVAGEYVGDKYFSAATRNEKLYEPRHNLFLVYHHRDSQDKTNSKDKAQVKIGQRTM